MLKNDEVDYCAKCTVKPIVKEHMCDDSISEELKQEIKENVPEERDYMIPVCEQCGQPINVECEEWTISEDNEPIHIDCIELRTGGGQLNVKDD